MDWIESTFFGQTSVATVLMTLAIVITTGLGLGAIRYRGIRLGIAGVLFSGLFFGHLGASIQHDVAEFIREFGLILFVYAVGLTVGPGFVNALRADGLRLNIFAALNVFLGLAITLGCCYLMNVPAPVAAGIFCGASTNTPSLAAAGQTLRDRPIPEESLEALVGSVVAKESPDGAEGNDLERPAALKSELAKLPGLGYAATYPFGVVGIILSMLILRRILNADPAKEAQDQESAERAHTPKMIRRSLRVTNPNLAGVCLKDVPASTELEVVISRVMRNDQQHIAEDDFRIAHGDILTVVGTPDHIKEFQMIVGTPVDLDLVQMPSNLSVRWMTVTQKDVVGRSVRDLGLAHRFHVQITRHRRNEVELPVYSDVPLSLADQLLVVGTEDHLTAAAKVVGDAPKSLLDTDLVTVFVGIGLGILLGIIPISLPGIPAPIKLGLAGGPLLVAIILSQRQRVGSLVWYLTPSANRLLRDLGISLFLAAIGLKSGDRFLETLLDGDGLLWMAIGAVVTVVPLVVVGLISSAIFKVPYVSAVGVMAGSMTDPPALAFANSQCGSEIPAVAYATVYPTTMILRVVSAQIIILLWTG